MFLRLATRFSIPRLTWIEPGGVRLPFTHISLYLTLNGKEQDKEN